jgi:hypothetical protein
MITRMTRPQELLRTKATTRGRLRLFIGSLAGLLAALLIASGLTFAVSLNRSFIGGPVIEGSRADDRGIERVLLPAGRYSYKDAYGGTIDAPLCGPRLLLGVRDGDDWLLSDGGVIARYGADPRITPLSAPARSITLRVALYTDPSRADATSLAAARASIFEFLPLYASLYTGGALTLEIEDAGELTPGEVSYSANGFSFIGPDLLEVRRAAGDDRVGLLLSPVRRNEPVRGLAYFDPLDARPGTYTSYTTWFRKAELWSSATGRALDASLSLDDLSGRELLELLTHTPEEINDTAVVAWHELLHVLEWRAQPAFEIHDWNEYGHSGVQEPWFAASRSVERSWYGIMSWAVLGEPLVEPHEIDPGCIEPSGSVSRPQ